MNQGAQDITASIALLVFEDINRNGRFDSNSDRLVARADIPAGLAVEQSKEVSIPVNAALRYRDAIVDALDRQRPTHHRTGRRQQLRPLWNVTSAGGQDLCQCCPAQRGTTHQRHRGQWDKHAAVGGEHPCLRQHLGRQLWAWYYLPKVDIGTGAVLGEYLSAPDGMGRCPS